MNRTPRFPDRTAVRRWLTALTLLVGALVLGARPTGAAQSDWTGLVPGISYREFRLPDPNRVFVARMERANDNVTIDSAIAGGVITNGKETVSGMANRYQDSLNAWGGEWGPRSRVIVAINGSFHDLESGIPEGGQIQSGTYAKRYEELGGYSGFVWTQRREPILGRCLAHPPGEQRLRVFPSEREFPIDDINGRVGRDQLVIFTPHYDTHTSPGAGSAQFLVELQAPASLHRYPQHARGVVRRVFTNGESVPIPFGYVVLAAKGDRADRMVESLLPGVEVGISYAVDPLGHNCRTVERTDWSEAYAGVNGSFPFLFEGRVRSFDDPGARARNPRTAVCFNDRFVFFLVVDGRQEDYSIGMTIDELADFCANALGAGYGINHDGGGSSAMWVMGEIVNRPSDGSEREVANGLLMVEVQPAEQSNRFSPGEPVELLSPTEIRLGPGTDYGVLASRAQGSTGVILPTLQGLQGIRAKGEYWWPGVFLGVEGWVAERTLSSLNTSNGPEQAPSSPPQSVDFEEEITPTAELAMAIARWLRGIAQWPGLDIGP